IIIGIIQVRFFAELLLELGKPRRRANAGLERLLGVRRPALRARVRWHLRAGIVARARSRRHRILRGELTPSGLAGFGRRAEIIEFVGEPIHQRAPCGLNTNNTTAHTTASVISAYTMV